MATLDGLEEQGVPREDVRPSFRSKTARHWLLDKAGVPSKDIRHRGLRRGGEDARCHLLFVPSG